MIGLEDTESLGAARAIEDFYRRMGVEVEARVMKRTGQYEYTIQIVPRTYKVENYLVQADAAERPRQLPLHGRVKVKHGDLEFFGTITEVNDPDQGDFEYYVVPISQGSYPGPGFWPRECLTLLPLGAKHQQQE